MHRATLWTARRTGAPSCTRVSTVRQNFLSLFARSTIHGKGAVAAGGDSAATVGPVPDSSGEEPFPKFSFSILPIQTQRPKDPALRSTQTKARDCREHHTPEAQVAKSLAEGMHSPCQANTALCNCALSSSTVPINVQSLLALRVVMDGHGLKSAVGRPVDRDIRSAAVIPDV
jgi:hypothetical protein